MTDRELATLYQVCASQLCEWKRQGAPIYSPRQLLRFMSDRGGRLPSLWYRLMDPDELEAVESTIQSLTQP